MDGQRDGWTDGQKGVETRCTQLTIQAPVSTKSKDDGWQKAGIELSEEPVPDNSAIYVDGKNFPTNVRFQHFQLKHDGWTYGPIDEHTD